MSGGKRKMTTLDDDSGIKLKKEDKAQQLFNDAIQQLENEQAESVKTERNVCVVTLPDPNVKDTRRFHAKCREMQEPESFMSVDSAVLAAMYAVLTKPNRFTRLAGAFDFTQVDPKEVELHLIIILGCRQDELKQEKKRIQEELDSINHLAGWVDSEDESTNSPTATNDDVCNAATSAATNSGASV